MKWFFILVVCCAGFVHRGEADGPIANIKDLIFVGIPDVVKSLVLAAVPNFPETVEAAVKCANEYLGSISICNLNTSIDPFAIINTCANGTALNDAVQKIQELIPKIESPVGVPEFASQSRCFDPVSLIPGIAKKTGKSIGSAFG